MSAPAAGPAAPGLVCAFAVTDTPVDEPALAAATGHEEGGPLRVLGADGLFLVVQDVPAALFDEGALAERLGRPEDLERCARAHHRGVEAASGRGPVVPLPLATLYRGEERAREAVSCRRAVLEALLDRLRDRTEWAVKVHAAEPAADAGPDGTPAGGGGGGGGGGSGGRAYLSRASARRRDRQDARARAAAEAEAVDAGLRGYAVAATRHRPQDERLTGLRAPQLLNAAYLVEDARREEFTAVLARIGADGPRRGVRVTASGPWIPYSFARWDEEPAPGRPARADAASGGREVRA